MKMIGLIGLCTLIILSGCNKIEESEYEEDYSKFTTSKDGDLCSDDNHCISGGYYCFPEIREII